MDNCSHHIERILKLNEQFNQILRAKYILIRFELGNRLITLYQRKLDNKFSPASTIKLFILDELLKSNLHMSLETVQIQEHHICQGSGNNLKIGQYYYLTDLIDNLTVSSSNTSAIVLQDYLEVSYEMDLVKHINKSNSLRGMRNSSLKNLHGLPERGQYFTLEDLSKFLDKKLYDDVFLEKLRIPSIQFESIGGQEVKEKNTCSFFYKFENEILGVKTGTLVPNVYNIVFFFKIGKQRGYIADFLNTTLLDQKHDVASTIQLLKGLRED